MNSTSTSADQYFGYDVTDSTGKRFPFVCSGGKFVLAAVHSGAINEGMSDVFGTAVEFFYLHMERALMQRVQGGEAVVGNLNLGRTRIHR